MIRDQRTVKFSTYVEGKKRTT